MTSWFPFIVSKCKGHTILCLCRHIGEAEVKLLLIRNSALGGFTLRKDLVFFIQEVEWVSRPVRTASKISPPPGSESRTIQPVASRCTDCDILAAMYYQQIN
jgi:hypothetical protein